MIKNQVQDKKETKKLFCIRRETLHDPKEGINGRHRCSEEMSRESGRTVASVGRTGGRDSAPGKGLEDCSEEGFFMGDWGGFGGMFAWSWHGGDCHESQ